MKYKYSMEILDATTELVFIIKERLNCSFDEACGVLRIIFHKVKSNEIKIDSSLKTLLPDFLEQVRCS